MCLPILSTYDFSYISLSFKHIPVNNVVVAKIPIPNFNLVYKWAPVRDISGAALNSPRAPSHG